MGFLRVIRRSDLDSDVGVAHAVARPTLRRLVGWLYRDVLAMYVWLRPGVRRSQASVGGGGEAFKRMLRQAWESGDGTSGNRKRAKAAAMRYGC